MGAHTKIGVILLALLASTTALHTLIPEGKELVYDYKAVIKAGTLTPANFASGFVLTGKLHIQLHGNFTNVQLADLKYKMYNGLLDHEHEYESHEVNLPAGVEDLTKVFSIVYEAHTGKVMGVLVDKSEKLWSVNFKKALAAVMQVDHDETFKHEHHPHAFVTKEHSIYGPVEVYYNVLPKDHYLEVQKMIHIHDQESLYTHTNTPLIRSFCEVPFQSPYSRDAQRKYWIVEDEGHKVVSYAEANGGVYYHPFEGLSDTQYMFVNQTMTLDEVVPIAKVLAAPADPFKINDLSYTYFDDIVDVETVPSIYLGRRDWNEKSMVTDILANFETIWAYGHKDNLNTKTPDIKEGQAVNIVKRLMMYLDVSGLELLYTQALTKPKHIQEIFYEILPLIGSKASTMMLYKFVVDKKVEDTVLSTMLYEFPAYVMAPTQKLLVAIEGLLHLDEAKYSWDVRKSAVLAYGDLISVSHRFLSKVHNSSYFSHHVQGVNLVAHSHYEGAADHDLDAFFIKYVDIYMKKLEETHDQDVVMAYVYGLANMGLEIIIPKLTPYLTGKIVVNQHAKLMILWTFVTVASEHDELMYEILWPIFTNPHEHIEIRMTAYWMIMEHLPTHQTYMNVYWYLKSMPNRELYHFHYSYVDQISKSTDVCYSKSKVEAKELLKYMSPPSHGDSEFFLNDYIDLKYKFGESLSGVVMSTNDTLIFDGVYAEQIFNAYHEDVVLSIKLQGFEIDKIDKNVVKNLKKDSKTVVLNEQLLNEITNTPAVAKDAHIELVVMINQKVVDTYYILYSEMNAFADLPWLKIILSNDHGEDQSIGISYDKFISVLFPLDIGLIGFGNFWTPHVLMNNLKLSKDFKDGIWTGHVENHAYMWSNAKHGLTFYNPFVDVNQGIHKYHTLDVVVPFVMDVSFNIPQMIFKISFGKTNDAKKDLGGVRSHVTSIVFVKEEGTKALKASNPEVEHFILVSAGDKYRHDYPIMSTEDTLAATIWDITFFDSEVEISNGTWSHANHMISQPFTKHFDTPFDHFVLTSMNWDTIMYLLPQPYTHGVLIRHSPSNQVTNIDLSVRFGIDIPDKPALEEHVYTPAMKFTSKWTYAIKNQGKSLKTWDFNGVLDLNEGHTVNNFKMYITRIIPDQKDYKICIEGVKKWSLEEVTGHLSVAMSQSSDGKCSKDDAVIDVTMVGTKSEEQLDGEHYYKLCQYPIPYGVHPYNTLECILAQSTVRKYVYNVKNINIPTEFKNHYYQLIDSVRAYNLPYFNYFNEHDHKVAEHHAQIEVTYPVTSDVVDINVFTSHHWYSVEGLPAWYWKWWGLMPDSLNYPTLFEVAHEVDDVAHLHLNYDHNVQNELKAKLTDWQYFVGDSEKDVKQGIYIKDHKNSILAMKVVSDSHTLEMNSADGWTVVADGKPVDFHKPLQNFEWLYWNKVEALGRNTSVALMLPRSGLYVEYDGHWLNVVVPETEYKWHGKAIEHSTV